MTFWPDAWGPILLPEAPIAELLVRGTAIYVFLYFLMRVSGRRLFSRLAMSDILVMLLIAVAVREGMTGDHYGVGDAAISGATILGWDMLVDRLAYRFEWLRGSLRHQPVPIIRHGQLIVENARDNLLTRPEIMERVRAQGLSSLDQVEEGYLEQDGTFTIVPK